MNHPTKISLLWLMLVICMVLHFDYHVSGIFYGIDVKKPDATGSYPPTLILIRGLFQVLPMAFALVPMFFSNKPVRLVLFILSAMYAPLHGFHIAGTLRETPVDPTQVQLLVFTFFVSLLLVAISWSWWKQDTPTIHS